MTSLLLIILYSILLAVAISLAARSLAKTTGSSILLSPNFDYYIISIIFSTKSQDNNFVHYLNLDQYIEYKNLSVHGLTYQ